MIGPLRQNDERVLTRAVIAETRERAITFFQERGMCRRYSANWRKFWRRRARRLRLRRLSEREMKLNKLREVEQRVLQNARRASDEETLATECWSRILAGEALDYLWYESWADWANHYWGHADAQDETRELTKRLEAIDRLLEDIDELQPHADIHDDVWNTLGLSDIGPAAWQREVSHMDLQGEYTAARHQAVPRKGAAALQHASVHEQAELVASGIDDSPLDLPDMVYSSSDDDSDDSDFEDDDSGDAPALADSTAVDLHSSNTACAGFALVDEDPALTMQDSTEMRVWWPLSTASRLHGRTLFEILSAERAQRCYLEMEAGDERPPACNVLSKILQCFKISAPDGKIPLLYDSGSTCSLSPYADHLVVRISCSTGITGIGNASAKEYSPCVLGGVDDQGQYHMINLPRMYRLDSLDVAILSGPTLEKGGYQSFLSSRSSYLTAPDGTVVPLVRDPGTGFHFFIDHIKAAPVLRAKSNLVASHSQRRKLDLPNPYKLDDAESTPTGPDTALSLDASLRSHFGTEHAWPAHEIDAQKLDAGPQPRDLVWAKLGKHYWPARIAEVNRAPPKVRAARRPDTILVHFFDHWDQVRADPLMWMYEWVSEARLAPFKAAFDTYCKSHKSKHLAAQIKEALALARDFQPDGWAVESQSDPYDVQQTPSRRGHLLSRLYTYPGATSTSTSCASSQRVSFRL